MASSAPKPPRRGGRNLDAPWDAGDSIPAPEAIEGGESVWALWSEANKVHEQRFAETAPASRPAPLPSENPAWAKTQPMRSVARPRKRSEGVSFFSLEAAMLVARRNNRVCPRPERWQELYEQLPPRKTLRGTQNPPVPPLGSAWAATPPLTKRLLFREHIEWAEATGSLETVMAYMQSMAETDWLHMGED